MNSPRTKSKIGMKMSTSMRADAPQHDRLDARQTRKVVTAGYPVLAVVTSRSLDTLAQARPGHTITFRKTTVPEATAKRRAALRELENLRSRVSTVFALLGIGKEPGWPELAPAAGS